MQRLDREFSPEKIGSNLVLDIGSAEFDSQAEIKDTKKEKEPPLAKGTSTEQLIHDLLKDCEDEEELKDVLQNEQLPGSCKSQYALQFRLDSDKANANFMQHVENIREKKVTKGRFPIQYQTNAGVWVQDREWKQKANPKAWNSEKRTENQDLAMLTKRKKQKLLQNTAMEA